MTSIIKGLPDSCNLYHPETGELDVGQLRMMFDAVYNGLSTVSSQLASIQNQYVPKIEGTAPIVPGGLGNEPLPEFKAGDYGYDGYKSSSDGDYEGLDLPDENGINEIIASFGVKIRDLGDALVLSTNFADKGESTAKSVMAGTDAETKAVLFKKILAGLGVVVEDSPEGGIKISVKSGSGIAIDENGVKIDSTYFVPNYFGYDENGKLTLTFPGGDKYRASDGTWKDLPTYQDTDTWRPELVKVNQAGFDNWVQLLPVSGQNPQQVLFIPLDDTFFGVGPLSNYSNGVTEADISATPVTLKDDSITVQKLNPNVAGSGLSWELVSDPGGDYYAMTLNIDKCFSYDTVTGKVHLNFDQVISSGKTLLVYDHATGEFSQLKGLNDGDTIKWESGVWTVGQSGGLPTAEEGKILVGQNGGTWSQVTLTGSANV